MKDAVNDAVKDAVKPINEKVDAMMRRMESRKSFDDKKNRGVWKMESDYGPIYGMECEASVTLARATKTKIHLNSFASCGLWPIMPHAITIQSHSQFCPFFLNLNPRTSTIAHM